VHSIRLHDEVEPGVPWALPSERTAALVTKAGAFGDAHTLRRSLERLHR